MKLKISHILIGLISVLSVGLLAQGVVGGWQLRAVNANALDLSGNWLPSVRELGELKYKVTRLRLVDARYVMASEAVNELDAVSESRAKNIDEVASRYETLISNAEERGLWTTFRRHWDEYLAMRSKIVAAARVVSGSNPDRLPCVKVCGAGALRNGHQPDRQQTADDVRSAHVRSSR